MICSVKNSTIVGISACVPKKKIFNKKIKGLQNKEKYIKLTGVQERYFDKNSLTSNLCYEAANKILKKLNWKKKDIKFLIFVSQTRDHILPSTACKLQDKLGLEKDVLAFDVPLGCSGYVYGLYLSFLLCQNLKKKGLLLAGDTVSKILDPKNKNLEALFGDAGTATAIDYSRSIFTKTHFIFNTDGSKFDKLILKNNNKYKKDYLHMDGKAIFDFSINEVPKQIKLFLKKKKIKKEKINYFIFHQANKFLVDTIAEKLNVPSNKVLYSINKFGNTNSASIPLTMIINAKHLNNRSLILSGFGVGLSWGSCQLKQKSIKTVLLKK